MEKVKGHARGSESNTIFQKPQKAVCLSVLSFVTFSRPQFQSYEVETLHAASTHEGAGFRPFEAGLRDLQGRQLIHAIWGVKKSKKEGVK